MADGEKKESGVKVRALLRYDEQILDRLMQEFDDNPLIRQILTVEGAHPFICELQEHVARARQELHEKMHEIYVSEVHFSEVVYHHGNSVPSRK